jgi:hypothetical protein
VVNIIPVIGSAEERRLYDNVRNYVKANPGLAYFFSFQEFCNTERSELFNIIPVIGPPGTITSGIMPACLQTG